MAILRWINAANDSVLQLQDLITYLLYDHKTSEKKLVGGRGCFYSHALRDFLCIKRLWHKEGGSLFEHFILSFSEWNAQHRIQEIMEISGLIAVYFHDFQCLYAVHTDTEHTHIHFLLNSVSFSDGKKFSQSKGDLHRFKAHCNEVLNRYGFAIIATASENIYIDDACMNGEFEMQDYEKNKNIDLGIDPENDTALEDDCAYTRQNWYFDDNQDEYGYDEEIDDEDEDDSIRSAFRWFRSRMIPAEFPDDEEDDECYTLCEKRDYSPSHEEEDDDNCFLIRQHHNATVLLDEDSDISPLREYLDEFRQSASKTRCEIISQCIEAAQEFEQRSVKRKIEIDTSVNVTLNFRKKRSRRFVDTCLADDEDEE